MRLSRANITAVLKTYDASLELTNFSQISSGNVNPMYEISTNKERLILRLIPERYEHYKIEKETYVYSLLREKTDLPVPKILFIDHSKKIPPLAYYLMTKLPGSILRFTKLAKKERLALYTQLGKDLAQIHSIQFSEIGWVYKNRISRYEDRYAKPLNSWKLVLLDFYNQVKKRMLRAKNCRYGELDKYSFIDLFPRIEDVLRQQNHLIDIAIQPVLLHNDYTLRNILAQKNAGRWNITGILDVEFARAAHNEYELACLDHFLYDKRNIMKYSDYGKAFLKGYQTKIKLSKDFEERKYVYLLLSFLSLVEFCAYDMSICDDAEVKFLYRSMLKIIRHFESSTSMAV